MTENVLEITDLKVCFPQKKFKFEALTNIHIQIPKGRITGIVGESGAGKSTIGRALLGLIDNPGYVANGEILLDGENITHKQENDYQKIRGNKVGYIFQNPMTALNPVLRISEQLEEAILANTTRKDKEATNYAIELLHRTGIKDAAEIMQKYPHQLSGGLCQRVVFAIAICAKPSLIIADEPTTALDMGVQRAVLNTLVDLCREDNISVMLITHDMGVVSEFCDYIYVLKNGKHVEEGKTAAVLSEPQETYTQNLLASIPRLDRRIERFKVLHKPTAGLEQATETMNSYFGTKSKSILDERKPILSVDNLCCDFYKKKGLFGKREKIRVVESVSFDVFPGEIVGIVGESGSGKTTVGMMIMGLVEKAEGSVEYLGKKFDEKTSGEELKKVRLSMQCIFQDPYSSLNPRMTAGDNIIYPLKVQNLLPDWISARELARTLLVRVGLNPNDVDRYPHMFSGGQRQRVSIARALAFKPDFIFCDEPTSALDVSVQAEILNLMKDLRDELNLSMLLVSHDLAVVRQMCDRVIVMNQGKVCETGDHEQIIMRPKHKYTKQLLEATPKFQYNTAG